MWPPVRNGSIASRSSVRTPERADAARPAHLVPGEREEVAADRLDVDAHVRCRLRRVADEDRALRVGPGDEALDVVDRADRVGDEVERRRPSRAPAPRSRRGRRGRARPASSIGMTRSGRRPGRRRPATGTKFEWWSISLTTTTSPGPRLALPHDCATRLSASVAFRTKTISCTAGALRNARTFSRAPSSAAVDRSPSSYTARCTFAYEVS